MGKTMTYFIHPSKKVHKTSLLGLDQTTMDFFPYIFLLVWSKYEFPLKISFLGTHEREENSLTNARGARKPPGPIFIISNRWGYKIIFMSRLRYWSM